MNLRVYFSHLSRREKTVISIGLAISVSIIIYGFILSPWIERYNNLERIIKRKEMQYTEMVQLQKEYLRLRKKLEDLEKVASRGRHNFSLLAFMEGISTKAKIKDHVISMKPLTFPVGEHYRESAVQVKIERVVLEQIVEYLKLIERSPRPLRVKTLHIRNRYDEPGMLDVNITVSFYEKVK